MQLQITLNQDEIEQAIIAHVKSCINVADGTTISVDLKAGRGDNGFSATLDIIPNIAKAIQGNIRMSPAEAKAAEEAAVAQTRALWAEHDAAKAAASEIPVKTADAAIAVAATPVDDSAAPKTVTKGLFGTKADTAIVDDLVNEEPTYSTDADALDPADPVEEEARKPAGKSIFSRAS